MNPPDWKIVLPETVQQLVRFVPVDASNWRECVKLPTGHDHKYVAPNVYSIAEAQFIHEPRSCCIYHGDDMVGYTLFFLYYDDDRKLGLWVNRLMIAEPQRGKGYARATMVQILAMARQQGCTEVGLDTHPENLKAIRLYESLGFRAVRLLEDGEMLYTLLLAAG